MKKMRWLLFAGLLCVCATLGVTLSAKAATVRETDVKAASGGNVLIGVEGSFEKADVTAILKRINEIRKEACDNGYINPDTGKALKKSDYVPIAWSSDLEWIAQTRAAEATVNESHTRPNGTSCFTASHGGQKSWAENLAWNYSGLMQGIEQWYGEKQDWVSQNKSAVTGHYTSLIAPSRRSVGIGCFHKKGGGFYATAGEFTSVSGLAATPSKYAGTVVQTVEVKKTVLTGTKLTAPSSLKKAKSKSLSVNYTVSYAGIMGGDNQTSGVCLDKITWKSSKASVLKVNAKGKITAKKKGKAKITAKISGGKKLSRTITVK